jgi:hypothetical protein
LEAVKVCRMPLSSQMLMPLGAAVLLTGMSASGAARGASPDPQTGSLAEASKAFDDAQFHHDGAAIDRFLSADFVFVTRSGQALGRSDFIAAVTTPGEVLEPFVIRDHRIRALGPGGGVVSGEGLVRGTQDGKSFSSHFRYADIFARRNGRWMVVYVQVTALPAP